MEVSELRDEFLLCRTLGHSWDDNPGAEVDSQLFKAARGGLFLRCSRCFTERFDYLDHQMAVFQRYYRYPQAYQGVRRGEEESLAPQLRAEMFSRSLLIRHARERKLRSVG
jgi:hypothetical protein